MKTPTPSLTSLLGRLEAALNEPSSALTTTPGVGVIRSAQDGILRIENMTGAKLGEVVSVDGTEARAMILQLEQDTAYAALFGNGQNIQENMLVRAEGTMLSIRAGAHLLGRVISPLGEALDGKTLPQKGAVMPLERIAASVMDRAPVDTPVQTGILAIDALIPIGRGQRELIIGDRQTGKTTIAIDTILNQKGKDMVCVYVAVAQREAKTASVVHTLEQHGAMDYTVIVNTGAADSALLQFLAPYAGVAIAEAFLAEGKDVLVVYDDLSKHAVAYRELSLLLRKPPGREAYPGDVFYLHSRLLERAVKLDAAHGGGSITALPIIETQANDVSAYIPTNVISITDGQIFLESNLFNQGIRPAMNVGISVSRVGSAAQTHIMKKSSGSIKLDLAQYNELAAFSQFASELDAATLKQLTRGERAVEALKQPAHSPYQLWQEALILRAMSQGRFDRIPKERVRQSIVTLLDEFQVRHATIIEAIETGKKLTDEITASIDTFFEAFFANHLETV